MPFEDLQALNGLNPTTVAHETKSLVLNALGLSTKIKNVTALD